MTRRSIKYLVYPYGDVGASQLMRLYGVSPCECIVIDYDRPHTLQGYTQEFLDSLIKLTIRSDGNYELPSAP